MKAAQRQLYVAEPPAVYLSRPALVVDCSVLCALLFEEPTRAQALQQMAGRSLHAPWLIEHEVVSVATKKLAQGWSEDSVRTALADYNKQRLELHGTDVSAQFELAQRYGLSPYDAAYLWLAAEMNAPLATFDRQLGKAAKRHLDPRSAQ